MKRLLLVAGLAFGTIATAQELPAPSPSAKVMQRVGLTDITIEYSRPSMRGREIFGDLVPYNEVWRTGANANTTIEFSTPVFINGKPLAAGKYSLITIPSEGEWTVIFNKKTDLWGAGTYNEEHDAMRTTVDVEETERAIETFTIGITDMSNDAANISLMWENSLVNIPMKVEVQKAAISNIEKALKESKEEDMWKVYRSAANYYHNNDIDNNKALEYVNRSLEMKDDTWYTYYLKAQILAKMNKVDEAQSTAEKAIEVGEKEAEKNDKKFTYEKMIMKEVEKWKSES